MATKKQPFAYVAIAIDNESMDPGGAVIEGDVYKSKDDAVEAGIAGALEGEPHLPFYIAEVWLIEKHTPKTTTDVEVLS